MQQLTLCRQTGRKSTSDEMPDSRFDGARRAPRRRDADVNLYRGESRTMAVVSKSRTYVRYYTVMRSCITQRDRVNYPQHG